MASYIQQLQAANPTAYNQLYGLMSYTAQGGTPEDWQAQIFTNLDTSKLNSPKTINTGRYIDVPSSYYDEYGFEHPGETLRQFVGETPQGYTPQYETTFNGEFTDYKLTGYTKKAGTANGLDIYANYDAQGNLTGYSGDPDKRNWVNGNQNFSGRWDAAGTANPLGNTSKSGGFFGNALQSLGPIAPLALAFALPGAGSALGSALGTSAATGSALVGAGLGALQGASGEDLLKGAALGAAGGALGSNVAGLTDSAALGSAAGTTATGLLAGKDLGTSLTEGAFSGVGTGLAGALNAPSMSEANAPDNIDVGGGWNPAGEQAAIANPTNFGNNNIPAGVVTSLLKSLFKDNSSGNGINMATNTTNNNQALNNLAGGLLGSFGNYMVGSRGAQAAQAQADQLRQAGAQAQQQAQFRPVGITNTFGTSQFTVNPQTGQLESAGYTLSPGLQTAQTTLMGNQAQNLTDLATIQNLGRGYLAQTPQQAAQQYIQNQQALLQPGREQAWANLAHPAYNRGTTGLKVAQGGGLQAANPYATALANAQAMQDLQLAAQAQQAGQQQTLFGQGLLSSAYQPYTTGLQAASATEQLGQQPFGLSTALANQAATANANAARLGLTGNVAAAQAALPANQYSPFGQLLSGAATSPLASGALGSLIGSTNVGQSLGKWLSSLSSDQLNQAASDWVTANPDITPQSTFNGGGVDYLDPETRRLLGLD